MNEWLIAERGNSRGFVPADCYPVWCGIEDLSARCGVDPVARFDWLRELPDAYPARSGRDPYELAEEHPLQALAILVRRFLAEYPEKAELLAAAGKETPKAA